MLELKRNLLFCFFFQAEDGIRDIGVTGVQTCALPICGMSAAVSMAKELGVKKTAAPSAGNAAGAFAAYASDRERGVEGKRVDLGGGRIIKKKKKINKRSMRYYLLYTRHNTRRSSSVCR